MRRKYSKRDFLKISAAGMGCAALGIPAFSLPVKKGGLMAPESSIPSAQGIGKHSKESPYYTVTPRGVKCQICPNLCILKEGQESICRNHVVKGEKLYSIAYGNPCAVHVEPVEKKPLFHFLPATRTFSIATAGCNFACLNCQNWEISQVSPKDTRNTDLMPAAVVSGALENNCRSISYTYSEPVTFYEYMYDTAKLARARGLKNIMVSNGYINEKPLRDLAGYIDAVNIDLKAFREETYSKLTGGSLQPVLNTLKILKENNVWIEITNLVVPSWTDDPAMITAMCQWLADQGFSGYPLHFSRFFPLYKLTSLPYTPENVLFRARETALKAGMKYVYIGNVPGTTASDTRCPHCGKVVVGRKGYTITENRLKNGCCGFCGTSVSGVWG